MKSFNKVVVLGVISITIGSAISPVTLELDCSSLEC